MDTELATRRAKDRAAATVTLANGHDTEDEKPSPSETGHHRYGAFQRPYIVESSSFANRLEVELLYADNELEVVRANISALENREADLVRIRDAALQGLGIIKQSNTDTEDEKNDA